MFELFKFKSNKKTKEYEVNIYAPVSGKAIAIENVDDNVFSQKAVGDGIAIEPTSNLVLAPFNGIIRLVHGSKHAVIIQGEQGIEVLIHIGIDTVELKGMGFTTLVKVEQKVKKGDPLIEFDMDYLMKHAKSLQTMVIITNLEDNYLNKIPLGVVKAGSDVLYSVTNKKKSDLSLSNSGSNSSNSNQTITQVITVLNESGLHARPASFIVSIVKKYKANILITKADGRANAKSLVEILGLGVSFNDQISIAATGEDAEAAVSALILAFAEGLGEEIATTNIAKVSSHEATTNVLENQELFKQINNQGTPTTLQGITIYPALVIGKTFLLEEEEIKIVEKSNLTKEQEENRLITAVSSVRKKLEQNVKAAKANNQHSQEEIFKAHIEVLSDEFLFNEAKSNIVNGKTAEFGWKVATNKTCEMLNQTKNQLLKERIADIKDIERSILYTLLGKEQQKIIFPENSIVIAKDLVPSDLTRFDDNVKGVILAQGSSTSHISIMMKNNGLPALVAVGTGVLTVNNNISVVLNTKNSQAIFNPLANEVNEINQQIKVLEVKSNKNLQDGNKPSITKDGVVIKVMGNVGNLEQAERAYQKGGEGIGLVRSEFLFFSTKAAPSEEDQYKSYQAICDSMQGNPVIVRTLDVGGDKPLAYMNIPREENPIVGLRGVRNYSDNKEIFLSQIRALLRVKPAGVCRIMIPMVTLVEEVLEIKQIIAEEKAKLNIADNIKIGTMIEVPAAALMAEQFSKHLDFLSIGTNDLAQYVLAMDRGHPILTKKIENLNPAVLKLIEMTCIGAQKYNIPVGVCGAMASEEEAVPLLVGLGVKDLSVSRDLIPDIKALIRNLDYNKCKELAQKALRMNSAFEVKNMIKKEFAELL